MTPTLDCELCGRTVRKNNARHRFCSRCNSLRNVALSRLTAHIRAAVSGAIRRGTLPPLAGLACVDCGKPARVYEHRDYSRPLDVEPTCYSCNGLRGPAANRPDNGALALRMLSESAAA